MAAALALSRQHTGQTGTNPSVGCVIVKDGVIIGAAVTAVGGRPHAETQALAKAGEAARGATAYVTLEPCSHYGRTPPCANALVAAGIARVVVCLADPDPRVSGRGFAILREAGITVETGVLEAEGRRTLAAYLMRQTRARAHVTLKLAVSKDGMIGRTGAGQVAITGPVSRANMQALRAETDAILVGIGTAIADDPELTVRLHGLEHRSPMRIVLDHHLRLPLTSKLVKSARNVPVIVAALRTPPSALPGISATRGEITPPPARPSPNSPHAASAPSAQASSATPHPTSANPSAVSAARTPADGQVMSSLISPSVGEMPGRAEGGALAPTPAYPSAEGVLAPTPAHPSADAAPAPTPASDTAQALSTRRQHLVEAGVEILEVDDLASLLTALATRGLSSVLVEGGATVARAFLEAGLVDRILLLEGPVEIGEGGIESPLARTDIPQEYSAVRRLRFGEDCCSEYERDFQCLQVS
ncbi:bifunctional diaminohydroxyphosphoribosylaminopyrimidine deaminase/5-amino-6-(5-phosphoribosylamino)uracil reductase RibD [Rhizobium sp. SGZ-381]|uniref:bifunctional diaminohydroxyphosphoribosylaminopyrimidine deaminase/5-amino-6-(5-phosphoribosylamino)uracil reductase RibD n=1 Tax=Rhizobium sp. SGZ-381 TaxID=3342800 RepID=UPI00366CB1EC